MEFECSTHVKVSDVYLSSLFEHFVALSEVLAFKCRLLLYTNFLSVSKSRSTRTLHFLIKLVELVVILVIYKQILRLVFMVDSDTVLNLLYSCGTLLIRELFDPVD